MTSLQEPDDKIEQLQQQLEGCGGKMLSKSASLLFTLGNIDSLNFKLF